MKFRGSLNTSIKLKISLTSPLNCVLQKFPRWDLADFHELILVIFYVCPILSLVEIQFLRIMIRCFSSLPVMFNPILLHKYCTRKMLSRS